jgi:hypothetical protein
MLKNIKILNKLHMQYCAILSQQNKHEEALEHAKYAVIFGHQALLKTIQIAESFLGANSSEENPISFKDATNPLSLAELTASKVLPILVELKLRCVGIIDGQSANRKSMSKIDMKNLFGYIENKETASGINIGSIMQMSPITLPDILADYDKNVEMTREALLEKIALLCASYFCMATEKRFLSINANTTRKEAEFWHAKALEVACCFLPVSCPIIGHIWISYQKHYSPLQDAIVK